MKKLLLFLILFACHDELTSTASETDSQQRSVTGDVLSQDIQIVTIPDVTVDAWVDPCADLQNTDELY